MNRIVSMTGAALVSVSVFLFAAFLIVDFTFGSYFVCMLLPIGFIIVAAAFKREAEDDVKLAADIGTIFAAVYAALIFIVYFAQTTTVRLEDLDEQAAKILDYKRGGLLFNYDLLGYGIMALSTFFTGLSVKPKDRPDKIMQLLMLIHGVFFFSCFILPMTGMFVNMSRGGGSNGGAIALVIWCAYFFPIGVLAFRRFRKSSDKK